MTERARVQRSAVDPEVLASAVGPAWRALQAAAGLAREQGATLYLVGGPVRDLLLGQPIEDLDLMVDGGGRPAAPGLGRALAAEHGGELVIHEAFATASWLSPEGWRLDLATARVEVYPAPAALPVVTPADALADLRRRDVTVNALALRLPEAELLDPLGGLDDLRRGRLVALHPRSFHDDPTRGLRLARYAARLGFEVADETLGWLEEAVDDGALEALGVERYGQELEILLGEDRARRALALAGAWGLLGRLSGRALWTPELDEDLRRLEAPGVAGEVRREARRLLLARALTPEERRETVRTVAEGGAARRRWLHGPRRVGAALGALTGAPARGAAVARILRDLDEVELHVARALAPPAAWPALDWWALEGRLVETVVDGHALQARGMAPGPALGAALRRARDAALDGGDAVAQWAAALGEPGEP